MSAAARMPFGLKTKQTKKLSKGTTTSNNSIGVMNWYEKQLDTYRYKRWYEIFYWCTQYKIIYQRSACMWKKLPISYGSRQYIMVNPLCDSLFQSVTL